MTDDLRATIARWRELVSKETGPEAADLTALLDAAERAQRLENALLAATANLAGASSAYRKYARRAGLPRAELDPFFTTRADDFDKAVERARRALKEPTDAG